MSAIDGVASGTRIRIIAACFAGGIGSVVLLGWASGHVELTREVAGFSAMTPITAVSLIALSACLLLRGRAKATILGVLASVPVVVGAAKLAQFATGAETGIDQVLFDSQLASFVDVPPNRMAPNTALALALIGISLVLSGAKHHQFKVASQVVALIVMGITLFAITGYVLDLATLYKMRTFNAMALHTAASLFAVSAGILAVNPHIGLVRILADEGPAGALARTTLPAAIMVPVVVGLFRLSGEQAGFYGTSDAVAIQVFANVLATFALLITSLAVLNRSDRQRRDRESAIRRSELLHRSILEASADCIKIIDLEGRLEKMNTPGLCALEIESFESVRDGLWVEFWPAESRAMVEAAISAAKAGEPARFSAFCPTAIGTPKWWDVVVSPILDENGAVSKILAISRDITIQRSAAAEIKWASEHDPLTGLANRRSFEAHLQAATIRAMQSDTNVGLLLLDLDHFKQVNDTLGYAAGDHLLSVFGKRLESSIRSSDFVARLGGDEFAVIMEGRDEKLDLPGAGESILLRLKEPISYEGRVMSTGASIGGALFPTDGSSANELFNNADTALYALKEGGRGGTKMFQNHMREEAQLVSSQLSLARSAITLKSVEPHYQQKIDLSTGRIAGFEALLRWRHTTRGIQQPATVAEAFKDYELASKIGELMQRRVFSDMRDWLERGIPVGFVAINAAPVEFLRDDFAEHLLARMHEHAIPPHLVEIEVTEHVFIERGIDFVGRALKMLSHAGVRIALDDFGTGFSSLSHLRDYPVDVVKIDRSFIDKVITDAEVCAIVRAVIDLAKSLNIEVVAEGVETEGQKQLLLDHGCALGQGYLFGRAIAADEVPNLLVISTTANAHRRLGDTWQRRLSAQKR